MAITSALSQQTSNSVTSTVTLPAGVSAGDLIIAIIGADSGAGTMTWPSPWVKIKDDAGSGFEFSVGYLIASGGETSVAVTHLTERSNHIAYRIPAAEWHGTTPPEIAAAATGSSTQPDPPNLDPAGWATENAWWIAVAVLDDSAPPGPVTAWPTNYTLNQAENGTATSAAYVAAAIRQLSASAENPGPFTLTGTETWSAYTIAVRPAGTAGAALAGTVASVSAVSGALTTAIRLAGTIASDSTMTGGLRGPAAALAGTIADVSTVSGALTTKIRLAGVIAGVSSVTGGFPTIALAGPLPAIGSVMVELFGPPPGSARWDDVGWGSLTWVDFAWQDATPESVNVKTNWGAGSAAQGTLTVPEAGTATVTTYDPDRILDPSNAGGPFASVLKPGTKFRVRYVGAATRDVFNGRLDVVTYSIQSQRGMVRALDGTARMANAKVAPTVKDKDGNPLSANQQDRMHELLGFAGLSDLDAGDFHTRFPNPTGPVLEQALPDNPISVWDWFLRDSIESLMAIWVGHDGTVNMENWGDPFDAGLTIGGASGIPLDDVEPEASLEGVYSRVIAYDVGAPTVPIVRTDDATLTNYGEIVYERTDPIGQAANWAGAVIADRGGAALQYNLGTIRPRTEAELLDLIDARMVDIVSIDVAVRDNGDDPLASPIAIDARIVGGSFEANTQSGWTATLNCYIPATDWSLF